jgi:hypothetical protein
MRDEASLLRLAEMGFAVYVPRGDISGAMPQAAAPSASLARASRDADADADAGDRARVVLLARADTAAARAVLESVRRALAFAHIDGVVASAADDGRFGDAAGLVVFGEALAREAGLALPAQRQNTLAWATAADAAAIAGNPQAKRSLWSELRRIVRTIRTPKA